MWWWFFFGVQAITSALSVLFNSTLIYLVCRYTGRQLDSYQYLIIVYAVFEMTYSILLFLAMPVHFMSTSSWVIYSYDGWLTKTPLGFAGPSLDCTFFELWLGFLVLHFVYRYLLIKNGIRSGETYKDTTNLRRFYTALFCLYACFTFFCGFFLCKIQAHSEEYHPIVEEFGLDPNISVYTLIATKDPTGKASSYGNALMFVHQTLVISSAAVIIFCSWKIRAAIFRLQTDGINRRRLQFQKQIFCSLIVQTLVPMVFCYIPTVIYLSLPYTSDGVALGALPLFFTTLSSIVKFINPIIVILCIGEYRIAALKIISGRPYFRLFQ